MPAQHVQAVSLGENCSSNKYRISWKVSSKNCEIVAQQLNKVYTRDAR